MPQKEGIAKRLEAYIERNNTMLRVDLLKNIYQYGINVQCFNGDGIIGDNHPVPNRMLKHVEKIVHYYLIQEMCYDKPPAGKFNLFATEGAIAAMCYIFDALIANELLTKGNKIALMTPIFTPYLEIPLLPRYNFEVVEIHASDVRENGTHSWQYPKFELQKLCDSEIKALFFVNPSNLPSVAINPDCTRDLVTIIKENNLNLMIISDDVYDTFVDNFRSLVSELPFNSIGVYSFSKYFGVTGWRLGTIALHQHNVFDKLLKTLPKNKTEKLRQRYGDLSINPDEIPFIDRIVADSRQVALNHTSGLSTPQQIQMAFFSAFALLDKENKYKELTKNICRRRQKLLFSGLGLDLTKDPYDASYSTEFDLLEWANLNYSHEFADYLQKNYKPVNILPLAEESSIVLLSDGGFRGPEWSIRISLANLNDETYSQMGKFLHKILQECAVSWKESTLSRTT